MIFPTHCRFIGVVDKAHRAAYRPDDTIYFSSRYMLIFETADRCDIYEVESEGDNGLLKKKTAIKLIADADSVRIYEKQVDITNRADLIRRAMSLCDGNIDTVVFKGIDRHMTFVHKPSFGGLTCIDVYDIIPPEPAWLAYNIKRLDEAGMFGELMLSFNYHITDLKQYEDPRKTVIFPCYASGLKGFFLDCLDEEPSGNIKLVGCNTSKSVFEARYPLKMYEHVNICHLTGTIPANPFVIRCCQSDRLGMTEINGIKGVAVHWGANPREIYDAVKQLAFIIKGI